jgi:probable F420-dependent oxidoreductase
MRFDAILPVDNLASVPGIASAAEEIGFSGLWVSETQHDPFLPVALAGAATSRVELGSAIAVAFPRSPTITAHSAWDLAQLSGGRFILGLGTQVKAHIERRFGVPWEAPVERLRDYIGAVRAVWRCWQTGERLRYEGKYYRLSLMTPFFSPGPIEHPDIPIYIAGVNRQLVVLAGEICDGFHVHPFHTARYLREAALPWLEEGLAKAGRTRKEIQVAAADFAIVGATAEERAAQREAVRRQVAFYASTPSYRTLLALHGWDEQGEQLSALASRGRWNEMSALVTDEMLSEFAVEGATLAGAAAALRERYQGLLDRTAFYVPYVPGERDEDWRSAVEIVGAKD